MRPLKNSKSIVISVVLGGVLTLLLVGPLSVYAQNDNQNPNWQVLSSNGQIEPATPFVRFSVYTSTPFKGSNPYFTYQMNSVVNGCTSFPTPCSGTYWMQGIVGLDAGSKIGQPPGWYVHDAHIEYLIGPSGNCGYSEGCDVSCPSLSIPQLVNINQTNYNAYEEITIDPTYPPIPLTLSLTVSNQNTGQVFYSVSQNCQLSGKGVTLVGFFTRLEGVIVGTDTTWNYQTFSPANTQLFSGYIDMLSAFNDMSNGNKQIQTGEGSNLYQQPSACYSFTYNGYYGYTIQSNEGTFSSEGKTCPP